MMPLGNFYRMSINFYRLSVIVLDANYVTVDGVDRRQISASRIVNAAVRPAKSAFLKRVFGNSMVDGDIGIWTTDPLYFDSEYDLGSTRTQSFTVYENRIYRIKSMSEWAPQTSAKVYLAGKHFDQDQYQQEFAAIQKFFVQGDWSFGAL